MVLLLLLGAHRFSTSCGFTVDKLNSNDLLVKFLPNKLLKRSTTSTRLGKFKNRACKDKTLSVIACFKDFIS